MSDEALQQRRSAGLCGINAGGNVAAVFNKLPESWNNFTVIDGDENDLRYLDYKNVVVGLVAKGKAKKDTSGFVIDYVSLAI